MTIDMYQASVPQFVKMLKNLSAILAKGEAFAAEKKIDGSVLVNARLAPDMFPLSRQVQIATDAAKGAAARLSGAENPKFEDNESSFGELQARVAKTIAFLESVPAEKIVGSEDKDIAFKVAGHDMSFKGLPYLLGYATPNVYFHVTTAYDILRHNGVQLGKKDYLG